MSTRWAILTGEYPPQPGGVADYTSLVARGLADAGDAVAVFAPSCAPGTQPAGAGVAVTRLPDHFGPRGLIVLDGALARWRPDRVLVQYVPHAYGYKSMNVPFAAWVAVRARRVAPVWVMFHEVRVEFRWRPWTNAVMGAAHAVMARLVAGAAERVFVAIPAWGQILRRICRPSRPAEWLPVPCNVETAADPTTVRRIRDEYANGPGTRLIGHFGTYGGVIAELLAPAAATVLRHVPDTRLALIGRGAEGFRDRFAADHPDLTDRVRAAGGLAADAVAAHLRACDLLVQPYPDGVSSRRGSVMACLANGVPVVSNLGALSESFWPSAGCLGLALTPSPDAIATAAEALLALPPPRRAEIGIQAAALYRERFSLETTIVRLRGGR
jgi:glycosyltransferase involved in cell wall biosynthesis